MTTKGKPKLNGWTKIIMWAVGAIAAGAVAYEQIWDNKADIATARDDIGEMSRDIGAIKIKQAEDSAVLKTLHDIAKRKWGDD